MNQKELNEIRRRFKPDRTAISKVYGCYVSSARQIISYIDAPMGLMSQEEQEMFLNLLNTDPELMTMMNYGTEGFTYNKNSDGTITFIAENRANYSPWTNGMGNVRILPPTDAQGVDFWDRFSAYYDAAEALPMGGFIFDSSELSTEAAALSNVYAEYAFNLMSGAVNPDDVLPTFLSKLEDAGINDFVGAAQEQLAAYMG